MAYVIARRDGRFEIRESRATPAGPRSRTLATFRVLDDQVLDHAERRATCRFDRSTVRRRARELGVPERAPDPCRAGWELLAQLSAPGAHLPPALGAALADRLSMESGSRLPDSIPPLLDWIGASLQERGDALRDLLRLTDRLPARTARPGKPFPRIASARQ